MNQLLNRLPEAQTKLFFGVLILFAAITVYFSLLAAIEISSRRSCWSITCSPAAPENRK